MIPKLIHQTYKTADVPKQWREYQQTVQVLHPDWTYRLWTDADNLAFVKGEFPDFLDTFVALPKNIMRADVIRYLLLYRLGGLYLDLDFEMLKPFDLVNHAAVMPWEVEGERLSNCFMASEPGHPLFKMIIDDLRANPPLNANVDDVLGATGPHYISMIYKRAAGSLDVHTPLPPLFSPPTPRSPRQYRAIVRAGVAYGIHHTHGSWREYSLVANIKRKIGNFIRWFT